MKASPESIRARIKMIRKFIREWNSAKSFSQVVKRSGLKPSAASAYATQLRIKGVPLKFFGHSTRQTEIDWKALREYARRFS